jgi:endonuclease I
MVAYVGSGTSFSPRHIIANTHYYFAVFPFNGVPTFENYKTDAPLTGDVTSLGLQEGSYYSGISLGSSFVNDLHTLINPHTVISYGNYKATVMNQFEVRDTVAGQSVVTCSYTGENKIFTGAFDWTAVGYSREHTFAHSWMPSYPADGNPAKPEYSDQHNLYPVNQNKANGVRSNYPFGVITGAVSSQYLDGKLGIGPGNQLVYEPRDSQKGNSARSLMYMAVSYNTVAGNTWSIPTYQDQAILKMWNEQDLPDNYEIARQEFIFNTQGNRNPFVDHPEWACHIDFTTVTYQANCSAGLSENEISIGVYPNPATDYIEIVSNSTVENVTITDMSGRIVLNLNNPSSTINVQSLTKGVYVLVAKANGVVRNQLIVKE